MDSKVFLSNWNSCEEKLRHWFSKAVFKEGLDQSYVDDYMQNTFLRSYEARSSYRGDSNFFGWLFIIGRNLWLNEYRRRRTLVFDSCYNMDFYFRDCNQEDLVLGGELVEIIETEMDNFSSSLWKGVLNGLIQEKTFKEIAGEVDCALGSVCSASSRIRDYLRPSLVDFL